MGCKRVVRVWELAKLAKPWVVEVVVVYIPEVSVAEV